MDILFSILAFAAGIFLLWLLFKVLGFSLKILWKLIINALVGALILVIFNVVGGIFGVTLDITPLSAIVTGVLGIPGVIILLLLKYLL